MKFYVVDGPLAGTTIELSRAVPEFIRGGLYCRHAVHTSGGLTTYVYALQADSVKNMIAFINGILP